MAKYITRREILSEACDRMVREMYMRAQPSVDINIYIDKFKSGELDPEKDRVYDWHYLPMEIQSQIVQDYLNAYGANDWLKRACEFLFELFKDGGRRIVYEDIFNTGEKVRSSEKTETLNELIGNENAEKVYKLMHDFLGFYRTNMDEHAIRGAIFKCPTSNPKTVIEKWGPDFKIDDSVYKGYNDEDWDYSYKDYYDGKLSEEYLEEKEWEEMEKNSNKEEEQS